MSRKLYFLMHKDLRLALFSLDEAGKTITRLKVMDESMDFLPLGYKKEEMIGYIYNRGIPATRNGINRDLGRMSPFEYMISNLGLSLTDCYWIKPVDSDYT